MSKIAKVRVCSSCEWIFRGCLDCPKCGFGSYGARFVYGPQAYEYEKTQKPWLDKKITAYALKISKEIEIGKV